LFAERIVRAKPRDKQALAPPARGEKMVKKLCVRCGIIFEVKDDPKFCSDKCKKLFRQSSLDYIKRDTPPRNNFAP